MSFVFEFPRKDIKRDFMVSRIRGLFLAIWYKTRYGKGIHFDRFPKLATGARINLKKGSVSIGKGFSMKSNAYCAIVNDGKLQIGNHVSINRNTIIVCHENISIGDGCAIAPNVAMYDHDHRFDMSGITSGYKTAPIIIEKNCWIGVGTVILRGTHIGEGCVIGAGCIIKGNIPAHSLVTSERSLLIKPIENK